MSIESQKKTDAVHNLLVLLKECEREDVSNMSDYVVTKMIDVLDELEASNAFPNTINSWYEKFCGIDRNGNEVNNGRV